MNQSSRRIQLSVSLVAIDVVGGYRGGGSLDGQRGLVLITVNVELGGLEACRVVGKAFVDAQVFLALHVHQNGARLVGFVHRLLADRVLGQMVEQLHLLLTVFGQVSVAELSAMLSTILVGLTQLFVSFAVFGFGG